MLVYVKNKRFPIVKSFGRHGIRNNQSSLTLRAKYLLTVDFFLNFAHINFRGFKTKITFLRIRIFAVLPNLGLSNQLRNCISVCTEILGLFDFYI